MLKPGMGPNPRVDWGRSNGDVTLFSHNCARSTRTVNQRSARGIGVSTPCGAVSSQENTIVVPGVSEL